MCFVSVRVLQMDDLSSQDTKATRCSSEEFNLLNKYSVLSRELDSFKAGKSLFRHIENTKNPVTRDGVVVERLGTTCILASLEMNPATTFSPVSPSLPSYCLCKVFACFFFEILFSYLVVG